MAITTSAPGAADACAGDCTRVGLILEADRVVLEAACGRFTAAGPWSPDGAGELLLPGRFEPGRGGDPVDASLRLQFPDATASGTLVRVTLLDAGGKVALGPLELVKQAGLPTGTPPGTCPP